MSTFFSTARESANIEATLYPPLAEEEEPAGAPLFNDHTLEGLGRSFMRGGASTLAAATGGIRTGARVLGALAGQPERRASRSYVSPAQTALDAAHDALGQTDPNFWNGIVRETTRGRREFLEYRAAMAPDPRQTSIAESVLGGLIEVGLPAAVGGIVAGPGGASALTGATFADMTNEDLLAEGVDAETARNAAFIEGASMSALVALPVALPARGAAFGARLAERAATGTGINVITGGVYRGGMEAYLRSRGYEEQAERYQWDDTQALAADAILGAAFGAVFGPRALRRAVRESEAPPSPQQVAAALVTRDRIHRDIETAPGVPLTDDARALHADSLATAARQAAAGEEIDVGAIWEDARAPDQPDLFAPRLDDRAVMDDAAFDAVREHMEAAGMPDLTARVDRLREEVRRRGREIDEWEALYSRDGPDDVPSLPMDEASRMGRADEGQRAPRRVTDIVTPRGETHETVLNPSEADILRLTRPGRVALGSAVERGVPIASSRGVRYIKDLEGNIYVGNSYDVTHHDLVTHYDLPNRGLLDSGEIIRLPDGTLELQNNDGAMPLQRGWLTGTRNPARSGESDLLASMGAGAGSSAADLRADLSRAFGGAADKLIEAGRIEIVESAADLRALLREAGLERFADAVREDARGYYLRGLGKAFIVAENISPGAARGLVLHEIGVHHGLADMLGARGFTALTRQMDLLVSGKHPLALRARARAEADAAVRAERGEANPDRFVAEETIAYLVETAPDLPPIRRLLATIRQWLWRAFPDLVNLTADDVRALAVASLRRAARQAEREIDEIRALDTREARESEMLGAAQREGYQGSDTGEAREWLDAVARGLPMDEASRMARAREMGFDVDTPLYHGSHRADLTELRRLHGVRQRKSEVLGEERGFNSLGVWLSNRGDEAGASMYFPRENGAVYPVVSRAQRPFVIHGSPEYNNPDQAFRRFGQFIDKIVPGEGAWQNRDMRPVREWLRDHGYDSVVLRNTYGDARKGMPPQDMHVILDDENIRSRFAAFDPARSGESDLLASRWDDSAPTERRTSGWAIRGRSDAPPSAPDFSTPEWAAAAFEARAKQERGERLTPIERWVLANDEGAEGLFSTRDQDDFHAQEPVDQALAEDPEMRLARAADGSFSAKFGREPDYAPIREAITAAPHNEATGHQWVDTIERAPNVSQEEMLWIGLPEFLTQNDARAATEMRAKLQGSETRLREIESALEIDRKPRGFQPKEELDTAPASKGVSRRDFLKGAMGAAGAAILRSPLDLQFTPLPNLTRNVIGGLQQLSKFELDHEFDNASHFLEMAIQDLRDRPGEFAQKYEAGFETTLNQYIDLARSLKLPPQINDQILAGRATHGILDDYLVPETGVEDWDVRRLVSHGQEWLDGEELTPAQMIRVEQTIAKGIGRALNAMEADNIRARMDDLNLRLEDGGERVFSRKEIAAFVAEKTGPDGGDVRAADALARVRAEAEDAPTLARGVDAVINCAIRHGGSS